jgi:sigma-B regulation protein RsbU (phosphoserine phosphatase)
VLHDNIRHRMKNDEHVTLTLLRHTPDGALVFAGAHEEMIVWRAATGECERIETLGTWLGIVADVSRAMRDDTLRLERGDVLVLYTDGITEARSSDGGCFGLDGICALLVENSTADVSVIRDRILEGVAAFRASQDDDETVVVLRQG